MPSSWLLDDDAEGEVGAPLASPAVALLEVSQAGIVSGGSSLTISLTHDRFRADRLAPGGADAFAVLQLASSLAAFPHEEPSGWAERLQPALSEAHLQLVGDSNSATTTSLHLTLPAAERYAISGPEVVRLSVPGYLLSCDTPLEIAAAILVTKPKLAPLGVPPAAGPRDGGTEVTVRARGA